MIKRKQFFSIAVFSIIILLFVPNSALCQLIHVESFGVQLVHDVDNGLWWQPTLDRYLNMNYFEALDQINEDNSNLYGGIGNWHLAGQGPELSKLEAALSGTSIGYFTPTDSWTTSDGEAFLYMGRTSDINDYNGVIYNLNVGFDDHPWLGPDRSAAFSLVLPIASSGLNMSSDTSGAWVVSSSSPAPDPTTMLLFGAGLVGLAGFGRKKFKK